MKLKKKIPYYLLLLIMVIGASIIIGFLSFGGVYALLPILPLAFLGFTLSVLYEGEIYKQNIAGALNKLLFKTDYIKRQLSNDYLLKNLPDHLKDENCPQFFKDYETQLRLLERFGHKRLDKDSRAKKKQVKKTLRDMEKWFATQLYAKPNSNQSAYEKELQDWLRSSKNSKFKEWQSKLTKRRIYYHAAKAFSILAGTFMAAGTTYMLVEAFGVMPLLAFLPFTFWPAFIIPMAIIAGIAYGLLTYNAVTDMINNDTLRKWYFKLRQDIRNGAFLKVALMATAAILLVGLAVALTICTAGTWWTIAKHSAPLFTWMVKMPTFIMGIINPIVTGLASLIFNLENTAETFEMVDEMTRRRGNFISRALKSIQKGYAKIRERENLVQLFNPFRLLLKILLVPLRIGLFLAHLIFIGVTTDRVPGVPNIASAILGILSEGFEDLHYFVGDEHDHHHENTIENLLEERHGDDHGHDHGNDIPTRALKVLFIPLFFAAAVWDYYASKKNTAPRPVIASFKDAWDKQWGKKAKATVNLDGEKKPSQDWQTEHAIYRIQRFKEKHLSSAVIRRKLAKEKAAELTEFQRTLQTQEEPDINDLIEEEQSKGLYTTQRFFIHKKKTSTEAFLYNLPERIGAAPVAEFNVHG